MWARLKRPEDDYRSADELPVRGTDVLIILKRFAAHGCAPSLAHIANEMNMTLSAS